MNKSPPADAPIERLILQSKEPGYETLREIKRGAETYTLRVHSPKLNSFILANYTKEDLQRVRNELGSSLDFSLDARGLAKASDRMEGAAEDPTHYDAVWVRDSLWVYLGLRSSPAEATKAKQLLLSLADYFSSPAQIGRFKAVIANPGILNGPGGAMNAVHIRFDRRSPDFRDVQENGRAQTWNHKQNDALGLFLDLFCRSVLEGEIRSRELTPQIREMVKLFPAYFNAVRFESMADAGSWEEIERVNSSSIGLVTSGLERLILARRFFPDIHVGEVLAMIDRGYSVLRKQLSLGGESPDYGVADPRHRTGDAALLNLIFPARLARLKKSDYDRILLAVKPLIAEVGIKRYLGDSYQSGNFWFHTAKTDDTSSEASFSERGTKFVPESEAQWFFDSWYSVATRILGKRYGDQKLEEESIKFLNRALAQVTGGSASAPLLGADGKPVPSVALPESYNTVFSAKSGERAFIPSPITPLNWAKAVMRLALKR